MAWYRQQGLLPSGASSRPTRLEGSVRCGSGITSCSPTAGAALLRPWARPRRAWRLVAGGVLIDADHYVVVLPAPAPPEPGGGRALLQWGRPAAARGDPRPPQSAALLLGVFCGRAPPAAAAAGRRWAWACTSRWTPITRRAWTRRARPRCMRDRLSCQACGSQARRSDTHLQRQPWLLPSYAPQNLISLCRPCHESRPRARDGGHARGPSLRRLRPLGTRARFRPAAAARCARLWGWPSGPSWCWPSCGW